MIRAIRLISRRLEPRVLAAAGVLVGTLALGATGLGQPAPASRPANAFNVLMREGRQSLATTVVNGQEMVALDDLARIFQLTVKEDTLAGGLTVSGRGKTLVLSTSQGLASAGGRLVSLSGAPARQGRSWFVPLDTMSRALPLVLGTPIDVRRPSRLVLVGDVRVPRIAVRTEAQGPRVRVLLDMDPATPHVIEQQQGRLVVRFEAEALDATITPVTPGDVLTSARLLENGTSVALDLGPAFTTYRASDQPGDRQQARLTIDLLPATGTATTAVTPPPGTPLPSPAVEQPPLLFESPTSALRTIVIDPGHGGTEHGARGPDGALEKDIALSVARQLKAMIESRLGLRVLLTRDGDQTVPLDDRAALANNNKADLFISLHANASVRESARGAEVFYLSAGEYNADLKQQAAFEGELMPVVSGGERRVELILWEMAQLQHLEDSATLATIVEQELRGKVPMSARAIQQAPFRVLVGANMPAVLVEMGFVTNVEEEKLLGSPPHQGTIAQALYESLVRFRAYLEGGRRPLTAGPSTAPATPSAGRTPGAPGAR